MQKLTPAAEAFLARWEPGLSLVGTEAEVRADLAGVLAAEARGAWVACAEALPAEGEEVLVWHPRATRPHLARLYGTEWRNDDTGYWWPEPITHWCPLPAGPEEGEGG
jgi:hypothetical protein